VALRGLKFQQFIGTGKTPWDPITMEDIEKNIEHLKKRNLKMVGLSAHDSCDESIKAFRSVFPDSFQDIKVGEKIVVGKGDF
jgi:hypothetical protein